jgi:hypothetical protein
MDNVIPLGNLTKLDLDPDIVLENTKGTLDSFVIVGWDKDGELYFASTMADGGEVLWLLEKTKKQLLDIEID